MEFITVTSIAGSVWSFRKDRIEMVIKRFDFSEEEKKGAPELKDMDSCAIIRLMENNQEFFCKDSYESIMERLQ